MPQATDPARVFAAARDRAGAAARTLRKRFAGSMLGLLTLGFLLVCAPLVAGMLITGQRVGQVTQQSESLLTAAVERTQAFRLMQERLIALERAARQFQILRDQEAYSQLGRRHSEFNVQLGEIAAFEATPEIGAVLARLDAVAGELSTMVLQSGALEPPTGWGETFQEAGRLTSQLLSLNDQAVDAEVGRLQALGQQARRATQFQLVVIIPIALAMAIGLANLLNRPLRKLDRGIRALARSSTEEIPDIRSPRDLRALSVRLRWARRRLDRVARDRQRLIGQVSHELKTPLSALQEGVSLLDDEVFGELTPRQREVMTILESNARRLQQQIESLLRFNRLSTEAMEVRPQAVALDRIVHRVLDDHAFALAARGLEADVDLHGELRAVTDPEMVRTALDNLVSNAVKFSPEGDRIAVHGTGDGTTIRIEVSNRGAAIPAAERDRVFDPFYRGRHAQGAVPGTGLGLTITRDLLRAVGAEVSLADREGWNTTFRVAIPVRQSRHGDDE